MAGEGEGEGEGEDERDRGREGETEVDERTLTLFNLAASHSSFVSDFSYFSLFSDFF